MFRSRSVRWQIAILALIPIVLGLVVGAITLPGRTQAAGLSLNRTATQTEFTVPGGPVATLAAKLASAATAPVAITLNGPATDLVNTSGQLLIGKTELVNFDLTSCGSITANQVCVTARAVVGTAKQHEADTRVKLATQLTSSVNDTTDAVECDLGASISATAQPRFVLQCGAGQAAAFGKTGFVTIWHQGTVLSLASEYMEYDNNNVGCTLAADQLCIVARALQPGNNQYAHSANGFAQPCVTTNALTCSSASTAGTSVVSKHLQITVASNAGFFPDGDLLVYTVDGSNNIVGAELMDHNNAASKIKTPASTEFHVTSRGAPTATLQRTAILAHSAGSIVTAPDDYWFCRIGWIQPGVDTDPLTVGVQEPAGQVAGTSVAAYPVCYTRSQPDSPPKAGAKLDVPVIGSIFIVLNGVGIPWLSTGGLTGTVLGDIEHVDPNGTDDGTLVLTSPCIQGLIPGVNLKVDLTVTVDKDHTTVDTGTIRVVLDTIPEGPGTTHVLCDDPAATGDLTQTTYIYPGDPTPGDDDTDGDGCTDIQELQPAIFTGGLRDPWNPYDLYDGNGDAAVTISDLLGTLNAVSVYNANYDRGGALIFGPFSHNRTGPDGTVDVFNDVVAVSGQLGHSCAPPSVPPPSGASCQDIPAVGLCLRAKSGSGETGVTSCDDPQKPSKCTVTLNEPFDLVLATNGIPPGGYGGFQSEILFDGLEWLQRTACNDEVVWPDGATQLCFAAQGPEGQAQHFGLTSFTLLPLSTFTGDLLELDVVCTQVGTYDVGLTAWPTSPFGGAYFDTTMSEITVAADSLRINCIDVVTDTPTHTNTPTLTSTPTITGTPTPTSTPTSALTSTPTITPTRTPSPTPTFIPDQGKIFPVAGGVGDTLLGPNAALSSPADVAVVDKGGGQVNVYIADAGHCRVRKVDEFGSISTIAGTGECGYNGDGGPATAAELDNPTGVAVDLVTGDVYIADEGNCLVRRVDAATGNISTFAGSIIAGEGDCGNGGDTGPATSAQLDGPYDVLVDGADVLIVDRNNCRVRVVTGGNIQPLAGSGTCGSSVDGGPAISADLDDPRRLALNGGTVYITEGGTSCRVRWIDGLDDIDTYAGDGSCGNGGESGPATSAQLNQPDGVVFDSAGILYIGDLGNCRVRQVDTSLNISNFAGKASGTACGYAGDGDEATSAELNGPAGLAVDVSDRLYIADRDNHRVRRVGSPITTVAGTGLPDFCGDGFVAITQSCLDKPYDVVLDDAGNIFIADAGNHRIRWIDVTTANIATFAGKTEQTSCVGASGNAADLCLANPQHIAVSPDNNLLYISDRDSNRVWRVNTNTGAVDRIVGTAAGSSGFCSDGSFSGNAACVEQPRGLALQQVGGVDKYLFIAEEGNNGSVRRVDLFFGTIKTVVVDPGSSTDVGLGSDGSLYISHPLANVIRRMDTGGDGLVDGDEGSTIVVAGTGSAGLANDGEVATAADLDYPTGVEVDADGQLLISNRNNHRLWVVTTGTSTPNIVDGETSELIYRAVGGGSPTPGFCGDPKPKPDPTPSNAHNARDACLRSPGDLFYDDINFALYFADEGNNRVRKVPSDCDDDGLTDLQELRGADGDPETEDDNTDPCDSDTDNDGCSDARELGPNEQNGGLREPNNQWDFYDVGNPAGYASTTGAKDRVVDLFNDIVLTIQAFGSYNVSADRGPSAGPHPWSMTAPDGNVDLFNDIVGVIQQFGHDCR